MNNLEVIICLVLLFMAVPDGCRMLGRPALAYSVFVVFGLLLGVVANPELETMLAEAGKVGFVLLLFEVGLEIDLPKPRELVAPLKYALGWLVVQYPLALLLGHAAGLSWPQALVATAALTACSVGMAYPAWKQHGGLPESARGFVLQVMVLLELLAILFLSLESTALEKGVGWLALFKLVGIVVVVLLLGRFAKKVETLFQVILTRTTHWRVHWLVLLVLGICAVGERFGLSGPKTAFVLGLFLSRIRHEGMELEHFIAPISQRFLIPVFFVSLGMRIEWQMLFTWPALLAFGSAFLLLAYRETLHRRWLPTGGDASTALLFGPNLTMVALAASALLGAGAGPEVVAWLVLTGLVMTVASILMLPATAAKVDGAPAPASGPSSPT